MIARPGAIVMGPNLLCLKGSAHAFAAPSKDNCPIEVMLMTTSQQAITTNHRTIVRIELPADLVEQYEALSILHGHTFDEHLSQTLARGLAWPDIAYVIDSVGDKEVRRLLGGRVDGQVKLLDMISRLVSVRVGGHKVELRPAVLEQIKWACQSLGRPVEEAAPQMIADAVSEKFRA